MIGRNDPCWCGSGEKWKKCHAPQLPPELSFDKNATRYRKQYGIFLKTPEQIEGIRKACQLSARILKEVSAIVKPGVTTEELNELAVQLHREAGAIAAAKNYGSPPFPKEICISTNDVVCHGIPGPRVIEEGDIINIDVASILDGYYGDCSAMVMVGDVSPGKRLVVEVAKECLDKATAILHPGTQVSQIGEVIYDHAISRGCSVVQDFVAHGVGIDFHEAPQIPHTPNRIHIPLVPGMTFTVEPMINEGSPDTLIDPIDQWTVRTVDGKASAQWEHTFLITDNGCEILTLA